MSIATNKPVLSPVHRERCLVLVEAFHVVGTIVPAGFQFDGASIPRPFWPILSPFDPRALRASLLHDFEYRRGPLVPRKFADVKFRRRLIEDGISRPVAWAMYLAVRAGAWGAWKG